MSTTSAIHSLRNCKVEYGLSGIAAAVFLPKLHEVVQIGNSSGIKALLIQGVIICCIRLRIRWIKWVQSVSKKAIAISAIGALICQEISRRYGSSYGFDMLAKTVLCLGTVPVLNEIIEQGLRTLFAGDADVPALLAIQLGLCLGYDSSGLVILLMLTGGELLEDYALNRAGNTLHSLLKQSPGTAHRKRPGKSATDNNCENVPAERLVPGDILLVKYGETIPVDGTIQDFATKDEVCYFDESMLTGENLRVEKRPGDQVFGGSLNKGPAAWIMVTRSYSMSIVALMKAQLRNALKRKGNIELNSKRIAAVFTPLTLAVAAMAMQVAYYQRMSISTRWERVLSVFMSATPCPASIGVPVAMLSGMSRSNSRYGGTIKSGTSFEVLGNVTTVVLDKTGTLTTGKPRVIRFELSEETDLAREKECLRLIASVETFSTHPLAGAICDYYKDQDSVLYPTSNIQQHESAGISAISKEFKVYIGTKAFFTSLSMEELIAMSSPEDKDNIVSYFLITSSDGRFYGAGRIYFEDELRATAKSLIDSLRRMHLRIVMLSGDRSYHLKKIALRLDIEEFYSCWPHEKANRIKDLQKEGEVVLMVGDGSNDAAALAQADVGLSIGASNLAAESADVVLMNEDLNNIANLIETGKRVTTIARRTVHLGMSASLVQMILAACGISSPFVSACTQEMIDLLSVLYALRSLFI